MTLGNAIAKIPTFVQGHATDAFLVQVARLVPAMTQPGLIVNVGIMMLQHGFVRVVLDPDWRGAQEFILLRVLARWHNHPDTTSARWAKIDTLTELGCVLAISNARRANTCTIITFSRKEYQAIAIA